MFASLLVALVPAAGCQGRPAEGVGAPFLRIGVGAGVTNRDASLAVWTQLLQGEGLLTRGWDGRANGRLASAWHWDDGGRALRLKLKPNVVFHDGTPLTADHVVRLLRERALTPIESRPIGFSHVTDVTSPDAATVLIRLSEPDVFLLTEIVDTFIVHPDKPGVATGPFRVVSRSPSVEVMRFDDYHDQVSPLAGVRILPYDTPRSAWAALLRGDVDAVRDVNREAIEFMERSSKVRTYSSLHPFYIAMVFNQRHPAFAHVEVRRALSTALDRAAIVERALRGRGRVAEDPIWPYHWAYSTSKSAVRFDPAAARVQLDKAGFRLPPAASEGQLRKRFSFRCLVYKEDPQYERIALMVQRQLFDIGVELVIELAGMDTFPARAASGNFDAFIFSLNASRSLEFTYRFWHSQTAGLLKMQNAGYTGADAGLDQLRRSTSDDDTRTAITGLTRTFHQDAPAAFIAWLEVTRAVDSRFDVGDDDRQQDPFANIWQWKLATEPGK